MAAESRLGRHHAGTRGALCCLPPGAPRRATQPGYTGRAIKGNENPTQRAERQAAIIIPEHHARQCGGENAGGNGKPARSTSDGSRERNGKSKRGKQGLPPPPPRLIVRRPTPFAARPAPCPLAVSAGCGLRTLIRGNLPSYLAVCRRRRPPWQGWQPVICAARPELSEGGTVCEHRAGVKVGGGEPSAARKSPPDPHNALAPPREPHRAIADWTGTA